MTSLSKIQEKLLLFKIANKNPDAYAQVYDAYVKEIYRYIYFKVATQQDAEDLTSEVFLKVWNYIVNSDEPVTNIRSLLYRVARNTVIDFYRRKAHADIQYDEELLLQIPDERQQHLLRQVETIMDMHQLEQLLRRIKDEYREVLLLKYVEQLSIQEIAKALDKNPGAVRVLLHRALKVLKHVAAQAEDTPHNERPAQTT